MPGLTASPNNIIAPTWTSQAPVITLTSTATPAPALTSNPTVTVVASVSLQGERTIGAYIIYWQQVTDSLYPTVTISTADQVPVQVESVSRLDELTGEDITGEGHPDVIIEAFSGGAHCCFTYYVYDLGPQLTKVLESPTYDCPGTFQDLDGDHIFEFVTCDDIFPYEYCAFAFSPMPTVIYRYESEKGYLPASPDFSEQYTDDIARDTKLATTAQPSGSGEWGGTTKCSVLPLVLDYLYSGQPNEAWAALRYYYKYSDLEAFQAEIEKRVKESTNFVLPPPSSP